VIAAETSNRNRKDNLMPAYPRLWRVFSGFFGMRLHMRVASARVGGTAGADRTGQSLDQRIIFSRELK